MSRAGVGLNVDTSRSSSESLCSCATVVEVEEVGTVSVSSEVGATTAIVFMEGKAAMEAVVESTVVAEEEEEEIEAAGTFVTV